MRTFLKTWMLMAILVMCCKVTLGKTILKSVNAVEVSSSVRTLSDTAKITIPRNCKELQTQNDIFKYINEGDPVQIELGYNDELYPVFDGYIERIGSSEPLVITCEDRMYKLRRTNAKSGIFNNIEVKQFLENQFADYTVVCPWESYKMNRFTVAKGSTLYDVLFELKKDPFGVYSYFSDEKTLRAGFAYDVHAGNITKQYCIRGKEGDNSMIVNIVTNELEYSNPDVKKLKIKAISNMPNGKKLVSMKGDPDGVLRSLNFYNMTQKELDWRAEEELKTMKLAGYRGKLTCFGWPGTKAGDKITITDRQYPDREGTYLVDAVTISFNENGYRRVLELGYKISENKKV